MQQAGVNILNGVRGIQTDNSPMFKADGPNDPEGILPLALIRSHTKTDDILRVTDAQLALYRQAAIEAAEKYTSFLIKESRMLQEPISLPRDYNHDTRRKFKHKLRYTSAEDYVYIVGPAVRERVPVEIGSRKIKLPNVFFSQDFQSCCDPCGNNGMSILFHLYYRAGFDRCESIPAGVKLGMLKFIAWNIQNPGDVFQSVRGNAYRGTGAQDGTNNAAWASGALEEWRIYNDDVVN